MNLWRSVFILAITLTLAAPAHAIELLYGTTGPSAALGDLGDIYVDTELSIIYKKTDYGTWTLVETFTTASSAISDTAYNATSWNAVTDIAPSKNAVRDQFEASLSDTAYNASSWDSVTTVAPSKNAVRDQFEASLSDVAYNESSWNAVTTVAPSKNAVRDQVEAILALDALKLPLTGGTLSAVLNVAPGAAVGIYNTSTGNVSAPAYKQDLGSGNYAGFYNQSGNFAVTVNGNQTASFESNKFNSAQPIALAAGAVSAPSLYLSDFQTGFYRVGANSLGLTVAGTLMMTMNATGLHMNGQPFQHSLTGSEPTCDSTTRGQEWFTPGGVGVADTLKVCRKDGSDVYAWTNLF